MADDSAELGIDIRDHVATVEIRRPPNNFFDMALIRQLADAYEALDADPACRAIVLCSAGKHFCAGADFGDGSEVSGGPIEGALDRLDVDHLYVEALRVFRCRKPVVAAIQGAAIGGGLGLAMSADFRVGCGETRLSANFTRLGFHPGFGLTVTLPRVIGQQKAALMLLTSRRIKGAEAAEWGLLDGLTTLDKVRAHAWGLAREIAVNAPLGVGSTRAALRLGLAEAVEEATGRELAEQRRLRTTQDFREGVAATRDRRIPTFTGR